MKTKHLAKIQAYFSSFKKEFENGTAVFTSLEIILMIIGVMVVIAGIFALYTGTLKDTTDSIGEQVKDAPEQMVTQIDNALNGTHHMS